MNRKTVGTAINEHFRVGIEADYPDFPVLRTEIGQYVAFAAALTTCSTVLDPDPKRARQIHALTNEIKEALRHEQENHRATEAAAE